MNPPNLPSPRRKVVLKLAHSHDSLPPAPTLSPEQLDQLLQQAREAGIPLHHDPQVAALLASLRLRQDVPPLLYVAAAAVLASVYRAAGEAPGAADDDPLVD